MVNIQWCIYYGDGGIFDNTNGSPEDAPALNVQVVAQVNDEMGRQYIVHRDYYVFDAAGDGAWAGVDLFGLWDYMSTPGFKIVKFGRVIHLSEYRRIVGIALRDDALPVKSAWEADEKDQFVGISIN